MMAVEYKHVQFDYGLLEVVSRSHYNAALITTLHEHSTGGWELRSTYHDGLWHVHLIFCREARQEAESSRQTRSLD